MSSHSSSLSSEPVATPEGSSSRGRSLSQHSSHFVRSIFPARGSYELPRYEIGNISLDGGPEVHIGDVTNHYYRGPKRDSDYLKFLQAIRLTSQEDDLEELRNKKGDVVPDTCRWFLTTKEYHEWDSKWDSQLLLLQGRPGIGKTMLSTFLVDEFRMKARQHQDITLIYSFSEYKERLSTIDDSRDTTSTILRHLLLQVLRAKPVLFKHVQQDYDEMKHRLPDLIGSLDALWRIFRQILQDHESGKVLVLIDGLDACEKSSRRRLLAYFRKYFATSGQNEHRGNKFLITYRPNQEIEKFLSNAGSHVHLDADMIQADLTRWIDVKVGELARHKSYPAALTRDIKTTLRDKAGGTFLWASIVLESISETTLTSNVREIMHNLPEKLCDVYEVAFGELRSEFGGSEHDAICILQCLAAAQRPLTTNEFAMAQALVINYASPRKSELPSSDTLEEFMDCYKCCGPLLYVDPKTGNINFVHSSLKEYLQTKCGRNNSRCSGFSEKEGHDVMLLACWRYLTMNEFDHGKKIINRVEPKFLRPRTLSKALLDSQLFLQYAVEFWQDHALSSSANIIREDMLNPEYLSEAPRMRDMWLYIAAKHGDHVKVRQLLEYRADPGTCTLSCKGNREYMTALQIASSKGHKEVVRLLLKNKANVEETDTSGWTALHYAASNGYKAVTRLLLESKADPTSKTETGLTVLRLAILSSRAAVVRLLLQYNANPTEEYEHGWTTLHMAAINGNIAIVRQLLENKVDPTQRDNAGRTALQLAAVHGHGSVVKLLLKNGSRIGEKDNLGWTAIHMSAFCGQQKVTRLLHNEDKHAARAVTQNELGWTALHIAAWKGHYTAVKDLCLYCHHDLDTRDKNGLTPLKLAAIRGHEEVVEFLVKQGADVNATKKQQGSVEYRAKNVLTKGHEDSFNGQINSGSLNPILREEIEKLFLVGIGGYGRSALILLAERGNNELVRLLIARCAKLEGRSDSGATALIHAAAAGQMSIAKLLLYVGAKIEAQDFEGRPALHHAMVRGHTQIIRLLLERKANIRSLNKYHKTPLELAALRGDKEIVQLFITQCECFKTYCKEESIMVYAAGNGWKIIIEQLIRMGICLESRDSEGNTALIAAAREGQDEMVRMLLDKGADIDAMDNEGNTALTYAMAETTHGLIRLVPSLRNKDVPYVRHLVTVDRRAATAQLLLARQHEQMTLASSKSEIGKLIRKWRIGNRSV